MSVVGVQARKTAVIPMCFGIFTLFLLAGYALFGRGFAYLGIPPVFVGEVGLVLAVAALLSGLVRPLWQSSVTWLLVAFILWGALRTFPYVGEYGIDALRDGVIWGYAIYALAVATVVLRFGAINDIVSLYRRALLPFLLLSFIVQATQMFAGDLIPRWPWGPTSGVGIIAVKPGDFAVNLCGIFAFITLSVSPTSLQPLLMFPWAVLAAPALLGGRGSFVTMFCTFCLNAMLRPSRRLIFVALFLGGSLGLAYVTDLEVAPGVGSGRVISVGQLMTNLQSIVSQSSNAELEGTKKWRELWWWKIFDYTFDGDYFWTGKGFGINVADDDGFQVEVDHGLRSPHSVHMTMLARAGVPGLALWVALQATFGITLFLRYLRDRRANRESLARTEAWILLYWMAFLINASFDVALEGPQGGILFWSVFGFGLALIVVRRNTTAMPLKLTKRTTLDQRATVSIAFGRR